MSDPFDSYDASASTDTTGELRLEGRSYVVTGSSRGIGLAVATDLASRGADVVVNGRDPDAVAAAVDTVRAVEGGGRIVSVAGSAHLPEVADELMAAATDDGRTLSGLVCCAGTAESVGSSILSVDAREWQDLIDAHLGTVFAACRAAAPLLVAAGGGAIVTTSSFAFTGEYGGTGYPAGKGAVNSLTYALAAELAEHGVRVNAVCPGARTRLSTGDDYEAQIRELHRRGLLDELSTDGALDPAGPEYVAPLYTYLVSPASDGITGGVFAGSGGYLGAFRAPKQDLLAYRDFHDSPPYTLAEIDTALRARTVRGTSGS